jgi:hypothetical protein
LRGQRAVKGWSVRDDFLAEGHERHRDELEVRDAERDPDDGDAEGEARGDVAGEPPSGEYQPEDVADAGGVRGVSAVHASDLPDRATRALRFRLNL